MELSGRGKKGAQAGDSVTLSNGPPLDEGVGPDESEPVVTRKPKAAGVAKVSTPSPTAVAATGEQPASRAVPEDSVVLMTVTGAAGTGGMFGSELGDGLEFQVTVSARTGGRRGSGASGRGRRHHRLGARVGGAGVLAAGLGRLLTWRRRVGKSWRGSIGRDRGLGKGLGRPRSRGR